MLMLKRNHILQARRETTGQAESQNRFEDGTESQTRLAGSTKAAGSEDSIGIEQILSMRVGCWRPPVYVSDVPAR